MTKNEKHIIQNEYKEIIKSLREAEIVFFANKRSVRNRAIFEFISAQEQIVYNLCVKLGITIENETD